VLVTGKRNSLEVNCTHTRDLRSSLSHTLSKTLQLVTYDAEQGDVTMSLTARTIRAYPSFSACSVTTEPCDHIGELGVTFVDGARYIVVAAPNGVQVLKAVLAGDADGVTADDIAEVSFVHGAHAARFVTPFQYTPADCKGTVGGEFELDACNLCRLPSDAMFNVCPTTTALATVDSSAATTAGGTTSGGSTTAVTTLTPTTTPGTGSSTTTTGVVSTSTEPVASTTSAIVEAAASTLRLAAAVVAAFAAVLAFAH
jgi:hypothetical protein